MHGVTTVLISEPDEQRRLLYTTALRDAGFHAIGAADSRAALSEAALRAPALIVVQLPGPTPDSLALCRQLRSESGKQRAPILVLTYFDDAYSRDQIIGAGATAVLIEPLKHHMLLVKSVKRLLMFSSGRRRAESDRSRNGASAAHEEESGDLEG